MTRRQSLVVDIVGAVDDKWSAIATGNLTYCVSNGFGANKAAVVSDMQSPRPAPASRTTTGVR